MRATEKLAGAVGFVAACLAMMIPRASFYRRRNPRLGPPRRRATPLRALSSENRKEVLDVLHSDEFVDKSPVEVWATRLDQGSHVCSVRTMYRILAAEGECRERRAQRTHPEYHKPELLALGPNQVWSWDITKLRGPAKWTYFYLHVVLDIFSRYVTGWMVADHENGTLARHLLEETCAKQAIKPGQLIIHQDRGTPMTSKTVAQMYVDLSVAPSYSRPQVSDDNPYSEAQFKTLKYRPGFPRRFGSIEDAIAHCRHFFHWYNTEHRHSGIAFMPPEAMHYGFAERIRQERQATLDAAYAAHPERFVNGPPRSAELPQAAWINPPATRHQSSPILPLPPNRGEQADPEGAFQKTDAPGCPRSDVDDPRRPVPSPPIVLLTGAAGQMPTGAHPLPAAIPHSTTVAH